MFWTVNGEPSQAGGPDESRLVRLYMELTGAEEAAARGVFMHVCCARNGARAPGEEVMSAAQIKEAGWGRFAQAPDAVSRWPEGLGAVPAPAAG